MKFSQLPLLFFILAAPLLATDVTITTPHVPNGRVDTSYYGIVRAADGCTPYVWAISSGSLPPGITKTRSANTTSLDLSGSPTKVSTYNFTVAVTDCKKHVSKKAYTVTIQKALEHVVDLSWKASTTKDVVGYNVYRGTTTKTSTKIADLVASTLFDDSTVENGSTYYYSVTAVDVEGKESKKTPAIKVVIP
jgi:hypothetical protein